jgi:plastocyanin
MPKARLFALTAVLALAAAACGGGTTTSKSGGGTTTGSSSSTSPITNKGTKDVSAKTESSVEIDDFYFEPTFMKVKDGQQLKLELENEGKAQHTFTITALNIDKVIDPGKKVDVTITFSGPSDVSFFCRFHGSMGMRGAFFFGSAPQTTAGGGTTGGGTTGTTY